MSPMYVVWRLRFTFAFKTKSSLLRKIWDLFLFIKFVLWCVTEWDYKSGETFAWNRFHLFLSQFDISICVTMFRFWNLNFFPFPFFKNCLCHCHLLSQIETLLIGLLGKYNVHFASIFNHAIKYEFNSFPMPLSALMKPFYSWMNQTIIYFIIVNDSIMKSQLRAAFHSNETAN